METSTGFDDIPHKLFNTFYKVTFTLFKKSSPPYLVVNFAHPVMTRILTDAIVI